jgi:NAD(P)H dehydrogenase (quinone)
MSSSLGSVLIYCGAGAQGSAIADAALAAGANVRLLLRQGSVNPFGGRVDVVRGDLADRDKLALASLGVDKIVLTLPHIPDADVITAFGRNAIDAASAAGVKLMVFNASGSVPEARSGAALVDAKRDVLAYLRQAGIPSIVLSPTLYMSNIAAPWSAPAIMHNGVFAYPLPADFTVSWISLEDLAAFAVEALKRPDLAGRTFRIGGPQILTGTEIAQTLSTVVGRRVSYAPIPLPDFAAALNASFGGTTGDETAAVYRWLTRQAPSRLAVDLEPALAELPIRPTRFADWAKAQDWAALAGNAKAA